MKILLLAASLRKNSCNKQLASLIGNICKQQNIFETTNLNFADFDVPHYNGDIEDNPGIPKNAIKFGELLNSHNGLIIATPEYNFSLPGVLKNFIDWVSRLKSNPWSKYPVMLCAASPALAGGSRGLLNALTVIQAACGGNVFPQMFSLGNAYDSFEQDGSLKDKTLEKRLNKHLTDFAEFVHNAKR